MQEYREPYVVEHLNSFVLKNDSGTKLDVDIMSHFTKREVLQNESGHHLNESIATILKELERINQNCSVQMDTIECPTTGLGYIQAATKEKTICSCPQAFLGKDKGMYCAQKFKKCSEVNEVNDEKQFILAESLAN